MATKKTGHMKEYTIKDISELVTLINKIDSSTSKTTDKSKKKVKVTFKGMVAGIVKKVATALA